MKKLFQKYQKSYMLRPIIYKIFTRFLITLTAALLWDRFVNDSGYLSVRIDAMTFFGVAFMALAWLAYLRLDGVKMPRFMRARGERISKKPKRGYGDMVDFVDDKPITFEELETDERDACSLAANVVCGVAFIIIAIV